jgi:hypothetical protein
VEQSNIFQYYQPVREGGILCTGKGRSFQQFFYIEPNLLKVKLHPHPSLSFDPPFLQPFLRIQHHILAAAAEPPLAAGTNLSLAQEAELLPVLAQSHHNSTVLHSPARSSCSAADAVVAAAAAPRTFQSGKNHMFHQRSDHFISHIGQLACLVHTCMLKSSRKPLVGSR